MGCDPRSGDSGRLEAQQLGLSRPPGQLGSGEVASPERMASYKQQSAGGVFQTAPFPPLARDARGFSQVFTVRTG